MRLVSQYDEIDRDLRKAHEESVESRYQSLCERRHLYSNELANIVDATDCGDPEDLELLMVHLGDCVSRIATWKTEVKALLRERNARAR